MTTSQSKMFFALSGQMKKVQEQKVPEWETGKENFVFEKRNALSRFDI